MSFSNHLNRHFQDIKAGGLINGVRKFIKLFLRFQVSFFIILICYVVYPLIKIRFGKLYSSRIGHLCYNIDNYLSLRKERNSKEWGIFITDEVISNTAIFSKWEDQERIIFSKFASLPLNLLHILIPSSRLLISYKKEMHPDFSTVSATPVNFTLNNLEINRGKKILKDIGIEKQFICFHNRDSAYLEYYGSDSNNHDFRDFEFDDFSLGIHNTCDTDVMAIRLGEIIKVESEIKNPLFMSLTGSKRSDFLDLYLISKCLFFVGGSTGFSNVSRILRKPELLVNYIPFDLKDLSAWASGSLVIPKKIIKLSERRYLRFSEMIELPYDIHYKGDFFADNGLRIENNSQDEISDATSEMQARVLGSWSDSNSQKQLQQQFWDSIQKNKYANLIRDNLGIRISSTFLERNKKLI